MRGDAVRAYHDAVPHRSRFRHLTSAIRSPVGHRIDFPPDGYREDSVSTDLSAASGVEVGESLLVVGAGTVGRWIADVLDVADTAFCDTDSATARTAADATGGRVVDIDSEERFDVVAIAVPISVATEAIAAHAPKADRAVFDVTGTMREPLAAMAEHAPDVECVSLHPLFAPERAPGTVAMVAENGNDVSDGNGGDDGRSADEGNGVETDGDREGENGNESVAAGIEAALRAANNEPFVTTAEEHDRAMVTVQARTHAAVLAFSLAAEPVDERFHTPVSGALSEIVARITDGTPRTYAEIQAVFGGSDDVAAAAAHLAEADSEEFERLYREASAGEGP